MPPDINEAYTRLGIEDPSAVDDDLLISLFNLRVCIIAHSASFILTHVVVGR